MKKNTDQYGKFQIEWFALPSIPWEQGPGVEFHYKKERGLLIGFIEGYEWHYKNSGPCKVYILSEDSEEWGEFQPKAHEIFIELQECIYQVLRERRFLGPIKGDIFAWPNPEPKTR
jgi:hypothetical protein